VLIEVSLLPFFAGLAVRLDGGPLRIGHLERLDLFHSGQSPGDLVGGHLRLIVHGGEAHREDFDLAPVGQVGRPDHNHLPVPDDPLERAHFPSPSASPRLGQLDSPHRSRRLTCRPRGLCPVFDGTLPDRSEYRPLTTLYRHRRQGRQQGRAGHSVHPLEHPRGFECPRRLRPMPECSIVRDWQALSQPRLRDAAPFSPLAVYKFFYKTTYARGLQEWMFVSFCCTIRYDRQDPRKINPVWHWKWRAR
jgi:hypothetical protein